jgi:DNA polymerase-3 subunit gamma/tau
VRICPNCGRENPPDRDFCVCGEYLRWELTGMMPSVAPDQVVKPQPAADDAPALDIERVRALWPAVVDAVRSENAMVGACLDAARPQTLEGDRLTLAFPAMAGFSRKTVERNRELLQTSLRALTGHALGLEYAAGEDNVPEEPEALSEEELIERLKAEYGATEVFDDDIEGA